MSGEFKNAKTESISTQSDDERPQVEQQTSGSRLLLLIRLLAIVAALLSAYLAIVSVSHRGLPLGCGSGSGCNEVLRSRWSFLFGIPMGAYAFLVYAGVLTGTFMVGPQRNFKTRSMGQTLLLTLATSVVLAIFWFVALQLLIVKAICLWCMADHLVGMITAAAIILHLQKSAVRGSAVQGSEIQASDENRQKISVARALLSGIVLTVALATLQIFFGQSGTRLARLPEDRNADSGPGADRQLAVLNGRLQVAVHDVPVLGSPDSAVPIVLLYDYCCPHCRATHEYLIERMTRYPVPYCIVLLPMPLDARCNASVTETEPRFAESCELARTALAVWRADKSAFPKFDAWLYETATPRRAADATTKAAELVGQEALNSALADPWIEKRIAADVDAYIASGVQQIPVVLSPRMDAVVGRAESADELFELLEIELQLTTAEP